MNVRSTLNHLLEYDSTQCNTERNYIWWNVLPSENVWPKVPSVRHQGGVRVASFTILVQYM